MRGTSRPPRRLGDKATKAESSRGARRAGSTGGAGRSRLARLIVLASSLPVLAPAAAASPAGTRGGSDLVVLLATEGCPALLLADGVARGLRRSARPHQLVAEKRVRAATARARAASALLAARRLYTHSGFAGCVSLLSITEQELGRNLADDDAQLVRRAHELLAEVNLWLGICQWAAADPQTAGASFVRSAQLPSSPAPDPALLPPELIEAHRRAVGAPREEVSCEVDAPLRLEDVLIDGRGPTVHEGALRVAAGTHYLVVRLPAQATSEPTGDAQVAMPAAPGRAKTVSLRLEASAHRCRVQLPVTLLPPALPCISLAEAKDPGFAAAIARETRARHALVVAEEEGQITVRLGGREPAAYARQLIARLQPREDIAAAVARSVGLLLSHDNPVPPTQGRGSRWHERWWVWTLAGAVLIAGVTAAVVTSREDRVRVVFTP